MGGVLGARDGAAGGQQLETRVHSAYGVCRQGNCCRCCGCCCCCCPWHSCWSVGLLRLSLLLPQLLPPNLARARAGAGAGAGARRAARTRAQLLLSSTMLSSRRSGEQPDGTFSLAETSHALTAGSEYLKGASTTIVTQDSGVQPSQPIVRALRTLPGRACPASFCSGCRDHP
jgi:hypothetical protein